MTTRSRTADEMGHLDELEDYGIRSWTKRESRSSAWVETLVLSADGREVPVVLTNISTAGCRIRSSEPLTAGDSQRSRAHAPHGGDRISVRRLVRDPAVVKRHKLKLQTLDLAAQMLRKLAAER